MKTRMHLELKVEIYFFRVHSLQCKIRADLDLVQLLYHEVLIRNRLITNQRPKSLKTDLLM